MSASRGKKQANSTGCRVQVPYGKKPGEKVEITFLFQSSKISFYKLQNYTVIGDGVLALALQTCATSGSSAAIISQSTVNLPPHTTHIGTEGMKSKNQ